MPYMCRPNAPPLSEPQLSTVLNTVNGTPKGPGQSPKSECPSFHYLRFPLSPWLPESPSSRAPSRGRNRVRLFLLGPWCPCPVGTIP